MVLHAYNQHKNFLETLDKVAAKKWEFKKREQKSSDQNSVFILYLSMIRARMKNKALRNNVIENERNILNCRMLRNIVLFFKSSKVCNNKEV